MKEELSNEMIGKIYEYDDTYRRQYDNVVKTLDRFFWWRFSIQSMVLDDEVDYLFFG